MKHVKLAIAVKLAVVSLCAFASCANKGAKAVVEQPPPCHNGGVSQVRTAEKLVITTCTFVQPCSCDSQEIVFAELKGAPGVRGPAGEPGARGGQGPAGQNAPEERAIAYCRHDPVTHRNHTMQLKPSEIVTKFAGFYGAQDFPSNCGETEGTCPCDSPVCNNPNPQVGHYFYGPEHD